MSERPSRCDASFPSSGVEEDFAAPAPLLLLLVLPPPPKTPAYFAIFAGSYQYNGSWALRNLASSALFFGRSFRCLVTFTASANLGSFSRAARNASSSRPRSLPEIPPTLSNIAPLILVGCLQA